MFMLAVDLFRYNHLLLGRLKDRLVGNSSGKDVSCVPTKVSRLSLALAGDVCQGRDNALLWIHLGGL